MKFKVIQRVLPGFQTPLPQLYECDQFAGYDGDALNDWLTINFGQDMVDKFRKYMYGQTMAMFLDEVGRQIGIVYQWDFERFMSGLPVID